MTLFDWSALALKILFVLGISFGMVPQLVWFERRGAAWMQARVGPNRVGIFGLMQPLADVIKLLSKESFIPAAASRFYYQLAPAISAIAPVAAMAAIPFGSFLIIGEHKVPLQIAQLDMGILAVLAFAGLEVYPIMLAGWASNNKYSMLGALRGSSQMVSYEIALGLALVSMLLIYGTLDLNTMVSYQDQSLLGFLPRWGVFLNPLACLIFLIAIFAETNRLPFDLPEGESELVAGYHLEYGAGKFALFFFAEYVAMMMASALYITIFFGGYALIPGTGWILNLFSTMLSPDMFQNLLALAQVASFIFKVGCMMFFFVWVRWTLPRFRYDQLMHLGWKLLFPIALVNLMAVALIIAWIGV
ncbi:MAG: NADH-quinone oxidoreductase subunit NuoH [Chitinophagaceae bacterium]|nr:NADH-quinone oxidoreductase subunit NuoH [Oligoflexus sp.]